jgi:hypothetical protein
VVAWVIEAHERDPTDSGWPDAWAHPVPITVDGILHDSAEWLHGRGGYRAITCLETDDGAGGRLWRFNGGWYALPSRAAAEAYALKSMTDSRTYAAERVTNGGSPTGSRAGAGARKAIRRRQVVAVGQEAAMICRSPARAQRHACTEGTNRERARIAKAEARRQPQQKGQALMATKKPTDQPKPRQADLPGTEDRAIKPLEDIAAAYADVRDRRIALNREEAELKAHALKLMHKHDKTIYRRDGVEIRIIDGEEDVKVKVKKAADEDADGAGTDAEADGAEA